MPRFSFGRAAAVSSFCLAIIVCAGDAASAAGLLAPLSASEARAAAMEAAPRGALIKRSRVVKLDASELAAHVAPLGADTAAERADQAASLDGVVTIELFPDASATFRRSSIEAAVDSGYVWAGHVNNNPAAEAVLIVDGGEVTAHIQLGRRIFRIAPLGNGLHRVLELNPNKFPPDHPKGWVEPPVRNSPAPDAAVDPDEKPKAVTTIKVLAAYTRRAADAVGGKAAAIAEVKLAGALANEAYKKGGLPMKLSLTIMSTGSYVEWDNLSDNLAVLQGQSVGGYPPELGSVRNKKASTKSDLAILVTGSAKDGCGLGQFTDTPNAGTSSVSNSAVAINCVSNLSFGHELGHNMGLRHDRFVDTASGVGYNFGYVNKGSKCRVRTMMAYDNACASVGGCTRLNMFSSDRVKATVGGKKCAMGINKGKSKAADNEQRLKETFKTISAYR